jgi:galactokinase
LRDDFEVSTSTMDALVDECVQQHGVFGARMVGGGFGGCVLVVHDPTVTVATSRAAWRVWAVDGALARLH